jgi:hypothetical protein
MHTLIIRSDNQEKLKAIKAFAKAMKIPFEVVKEKPSDPELLTLAKKGKTTE